MRAVFVWVFVMLLAVPALAAPREGTVELEKTPWGMTRADVVQMLNINPPEGDGQIVLKARLYDHEAGMIYIFWQGKLAAVNVQVIKGLDETIAKNLVSRIRNDLSARYGEAVKKDALCYQESQCTYSLWQKDLETNVVLQHERSQGLERVTLIYASSAAQAAMRKAEEAK